MDFAEALSQLDYQPVVAAVLKQCVGAVSKHQVGNLFLLCETKHRLKLVCIFNLNQSESLAARPERSVFAHVCVFCDAKSIAALSFRQKLCQPLC